MKRHIPYIIAALVGFHLRWIASALNGWDYSMSGMDIAAAITCLVMVWSFKGLLPKRKEDKPYALQQSDPRQGRR